MMNIKTNKTGWKVCVDSINKTEFFINGYLDAVSYCKYQMQE